MIRCRRARRAVTANGYGQDPLLPLVHVIARRETPILEQGQTLTQRHRQTDPALKTEQSIAQWLPKRVSSGRVILAVNENLVMVTSSSLLLSGIARTRCAGMRVASQSFRSSSYR